MRRLILFFVCLLAGCSPKKSYVVLYTSQDQFYAEPILNEFTAATGIEVRPVFDTESAKTAALANRLRAEEKNPQCDVFWSNEELHTRLLVLEGVIPNDEWKAAGARTRRLVINTNLISAGQAPASLLDLTNAVWNGRVALAYPLFGTTKSHFLALRQLWGEELWKSWCYGLIRNGAKIVDGNSVVVKLVGAGECAIGLTDSDDISAGRKQGFPIAALEPTGESIAIPSTAGLIWNAPHAAEGARLIEFLTRRETLQRLVEAGALESVEAGAQRTNLYQMDWKRALGELDETLDFLQLIFVRS